MENYQGQYIGTEGLENTLPKSNYGLVQTKILRVSDESPSPGRYRGTQYREITVDIDPWRNHNPKDIPEMAIRDQTNLEFSSHAYIELLDTFDVSPKRLIGKIVQVVFLEDRHDSIGIATTLDTVVAEH